MRRGTILGTALAAGAALVLALGCGEERTTEEDVEREMGEAAETTREYLEDQKESYQTRLRRQIERLDERIHDAEPEAAERLEASREEARELLARVGDATRDEWERVKREVDETLAELGER